MDLDIAILEIIERKDDLSHDQVERLIRGVSADTDEISDGRHTFGELYEHRRALTAVLAATLIWYAPFGQTAWRSKRHHPDDPSPMFDDSFIVGIELPTGQILYHYKLEHWNDFAAVPEIEHAPKWDGAGPADTVTRLLELARMIPAGVETYACPDCGDDISAGDDHQCDRRILHRNPDHGVSLGEQLDRTNDAIAAGVDPVDALADLDEWKRGGGWKLIGPAHAHNDGPCSDTCYEASE
jgi:hypothetical protein